MLVATLATRSFLPGARVLASSLAEHQPDAEIVCLAVDGRPGDPAEAFATLLPQELGLPEGALERITASHPASGYTGALKAPLLMHLLARSCGPVVLLDADILVTAPISPFAELTGEAPVVLTAHLHGVADRRTDQQMVQTGTYNAGMLAVAPGAEAFLAWWSSRTSRECLADPASGLYVEQRWLDLAPQLFSTTMERDPGQNVVNHQLEHRDFVADGAAYRIDGVPVRTFHFGGRFDPLHPYGSTTRTIRPTLRPSRHPALARLYREYARALLDAGWFTDHALESRWERLPSGRRLDPTMRRTYRNALIRAEGGGSPEPPNPFSDERGFLAWLAAPVDRRRMAINVARYAVELPVELPELANRFPDRLGAGASRYLEHLAVHHPEVPAELREVDVPQSPQPPAGPFELIPGVSLAGPFPAASVQGDLCRALRGALDEAGVAHADVPWQADVGWRRAMDPGSAAHAVHDVNVVVVEPSDLPDFDYELGVSFRPWRYVIGVWTTVPDGADDAAFDLVDEVWTPSAAVAHGVRSRTDKPVEVIPLDAEPVPVDSRATLDLPTGPLTGMLVDVGAPSLAVAVSSVRAALDAPRTGALLVVLLRSEDDLLEAERVIGWAQDAGAIWREADREQARRLLAACDDLRADAEEVALEPVLNDAAGMLQGVRRDGLAPWVVGRLRALEDAGIVPVGPRAGT